MRIAIHVAKASVQVQNEAGELIAVATVEDYAFDGDITKLGEAAVAMVQTIQTAIDEA